MSMGVGQEELTGDWMSGFVTQNGQATSNWGKILGINCFLGRTSQKAPISGISPCFRKGNNHNYS